MPTYAYRCPSCGHEYERLQKITDKTLAKCPKCGTRGERQISGGAGLVFKGSGFYITDYKRAGDKGSSGEKKKDTASDASSKAKPDTKGPGADS
jgi:putative FmdB family regulatory protein